MCSSLRCGAFFRGDLLLAIVCGVLRRLCAPRSGVGRWRSFCVPCLIFRGPFRWPFRGSLRVCFPCFLAAKLFVVSHVSSSVKSQTGEPSREEGRRPSGPLQGPNIHQHLERLDPHAVEFRKTLNPELLHNADTQCDDTPPTPVHGGGVSQEGPPRSD